MMLLGPSLHKITRYEGCSLFIATWVLKHKGIVIYLKTLVHPFKYSPFEQIQSLGHVVSFAMDDILTFLVAHILLLHFLVGW